jgi:uncharacterized protein YjbI with pentapeptide repeats
LVFQGSIIGLGLYYNTVDQYKIQVSAISKCQYKSYYYADFECDELPLDTGSKFCIFHDINYLKATHDSLYYYRKEQVVKRLKEKLSEYCSNHRPLKFIGYFLPEISFKNRQFAEALYFSDTTFYGVADFSGVRFSSQADFSRARFTQAYFRDSTFDGDVNLQGSFNESIYFSNAEFNDRAHFVGAIFGVANFVGAKFSGEAAFTSAIFFGVANFFGAIFSWTANFEEATFSDEAFFGSATFSDEAFERAMGDFIPLLTLPSEIKVGLIDFVIKIVGGAVTFGLLAIALRRKFERKYTR